MAEANSKVNAKFILRFGEIALKGGNRPRFEKMLVDSVRRTLAGTGANIEREAARAQLVVQCSAARADEVSGKLATVFGVVWYARTHACRSTLADMAALAADLAEGALLPGESFAVRATRSDKRLPFNSLDIEVAVGQAIVDRTGAQVDLGQPDREFFVYAGPEVTDITGQKMAGSGGLPVGSSRKVLSLLSGGFDSIASSYHLARRGAKVDFVHFHVYPNQERLLKSKMPRIWEKLSVYTLSQRVYLVSDFPFQAAILALKGRDARLELVVFRRLMARVAQRIAVRKRHMALVFGDSLGQVASQTMENIVAVDRAVDIPVFRPLIGTDKQEVMDLVRHIGLHREASEAYKDCCSIISNHPATKATLTEIEDLEARLGIPGLVHEMAHSAEIVEIGKMAVVPAGEGVG